MQEAHAAVANPSADSGCRSAILRPDVGVLFVRGRDAVSFIDGLSTNHIPNTPGSALRTVFTDRAAKVIAVATVMVREEGVVLLVHRERWPALLDHLTPRQLGQDVAMLDLSDRNHVVYRTGSRGPPSGTWHTEEGVTSARVHDDLSILVVAGSSKAAHAQNPDAWTAWRSPTDGRRWGSKSRRSITPTHADWNPWCMKTKGATSAKKF